MSSGLKAISLDKASSSAFSSFFSLRILFSSLDTFVYSDIFWEAAFFADSSSLEATDTFSSAAAIASLHFSRSTCAFSIVDSTCSVALLLISSNIFSEIFFAPSATFAAIASAAFFASITLSAAICDASFAFCFRSDISPSIFSLVAPAVSFARVSICFAFSPAILAASFAFSSAFLAPSWAKFSASLNFLLACMLASSMASLLASAASVVFSLIMLAICSALAAWSFASSAPFIAAVEASCLLSSARVVSFSSAAVAAIFDSSMARIATTSAFLAAFAASVFAAERALSVSPFAFNAAFSIPSCANFAPGVSFWIPSAAKSDTFSPAFWASSLSFDVCAPNLSAVSPTASPTFPEIASAILRLLLTTALCMTASKLLFMCLWASNSWSRAYSFNFFSWSSFSVSLNLATNKYVLIGEIMSVNAMTHRFMIFAPNKIMSCASLLFQP